MTTAATETVTNPTRTKGAAATIRDGVDLNALGTVAMDGAIDVAGATIKAAGQGFGAAMGVGAAYCVLKAMGAPIP